MAQDMIQLSDGQESGGGRSQEDSRVELEPERGLFAVTHQMPPDLLRYLKKHIKLKRKLKLRYGVFAHKITSQVRTSADYRIKSST
ncbi:MAG: hypothetical protein IH962_01205 [Chloroflexi bacterium]|nr:hypothetical protein [Chloroflexota bacterium]